MTHTLPELLAPAGSIDALLAAVAAGADAVYCGLGAFNARASAADIELATFAQAVRFAHERGVRVYVTCNVYVRDYEIEDALALARDAIAAGADALIVADAGFIELLQREIPGVEIHLSTQTGVMSAAGAAYVARELGVERVTVSRELSIDEISDLAQVGLPIEVFCHGAICICYSGACAFSALRRGRSANRGDCTQPCRLAYDLQDEEGTSLIGVEGDRLLCPRDYCSIEHVDELVHAGVSALKIEGRMKNPDYVYNVVSAYRCALDAVAAGTYDATLVRELKRQLGMSFNRGFTDAYLRGTSGAELMSFERACNQGVAVGELIERLHEEVVIAFDADVHVGDMLEIRSTPGPDAPKDVPKRWPQVPCTVDVRAGERAVVHCKRKVEVGSKVHLTSSAAVLKQADEAVRIMRAEAGLLDTSGAASSVKPKAVTVPEATPSPSTEAAAKSAIATEGVRAPRINVLAVDMSQAESLLQDARVERVLVRQETLRADMSSWAELLPRLTVVLDEPARSCDEDFMLEVAKRCKHVVCRNYRQLAHMGEQNLAFDIAAPLSATNGHTAAWFTAHRVSCVWLPDELSVEEVTRASATARTLGAEAVGVLVYGRPQLMVCEHCLLTVEGSCSATCAACKRRQQPRWLVERNGSRLPVRIDRAGRTRIYNDAPLDRLSQVDELLCAGVSDMLIDARLLDADELKRALQALAEATA